MGAAGWRGGIGLTTEVVAVSISAVAVIVSLWSAVQSYQSVKRQNEWQERLLHLEEAEARSRSAAAQSAKLRAEVDQSGESPALLVTNDGAAEARNISVKIDGIPISEDSSVVNQEEVRQLGPGGSFRYILATQTLDSPSLVRIEIGWVDGVGTAHSWRSELSLIG